jgi:hypothetical protein
MSISYFILIIEYAFQISRFVDYYGVMTVTVCATILFITTYLMLKPEILYGIQGFVKVPDVQSAHESSQEIISKSSLKLEKWCRIMRVDLRRVKSEIIWK